MSVWISVVVKDNGRVLKGPCLLKGNFHDSVGSLVEALGFSDRTFSRIIASKSECFSCPHEIALDTPLSVCHDFQLKVSESNVCANCVDYSRNDVIYINNLKEVMLIGFVFIFLPTYLPTFFQESTRETKNLLGMALYTPGTHSKQQI